MIGPARSPRLLRLLHWWVALAVLPQWALGLAAERVADRDLSWQLLHWHFQLGMLVLVLMVLRLCTRLLLVRRLPPAGEPAWRRRIAAGVHLLLYALLFVLPLSGYVIWVWMEAPLLLWKAIPVPALFTPPADETGRAIAWYLHVGAAWLLAALLCLHVAAAAQRRMAKRSTTTRIAVDSSIHSPAQTGAGNQVSSAMVCASERTSLLPDSCHSSNRLL